MPSSQRTTGNRINQHFTRLYHNKLKALTLLFFIFYSQYVIYAFCTRTDEINHI